MLRRKKAQTSLLVIAGIVIFIIATLLTTVSERISEGALDTALQQQEQRIAEEKTLDWQYRQAIRAALFDALVAFGNKEWQRQQPKIFLEMHMEKNLPEYFSFAETENESPEVTITLQEKRIFAKVIFPVKKERVDYTVEKREEEIMVIYSLPSAITTAQQRGTGSIDSRFIVEDKKIRDTSLWWRGDYLTYSE